MLDTNITELYEVIKGLKNKRSSGIDNISLKPIYNLPVNLINLLVILINGFFGLDIFPSVLKTSLVIPVHKGGDTNTPSNLSPKNLIRTLAKIIEKYIIVYEV